MTSVLGIDAAWTPANASGVALARYRDGAWNLDIVASSYEEFAGDKSVEPTNLLRATGDDVALVAIDMPLALEPIKGRRAADTAVSRAFGARGCAVHSPSSSRPGPLACKIRNGFEQAGFQLSTKLVTGRSLIEVYPHVAAMALIKADYRVPYKVSRMSRYWPDDEIVVRKQKIFSQWAELITALDKVVVGTASCLPLPKPESSLSELKRFEDALDAVICAWVGVLALEGCAVPYGDESAAIWVPSAAI